MGQILIWDFSSIHILLLKEIYFGMFKWSIYDTLGYINLGLLSTQLSLYQAYTMRRCSYKLAWQGQLYEINHLHFKNNFMMHNSLMAGDCMKFAPHGFILKTHSN